MMARGRNVRALSTVARGVAHGVLSSVVLTTVILLAELAAARPGPPPKTPPWLAVETRPIFGDTSVTSKSWTEIWVRLSNNGSVKRGGQIRLLSDGEQKNDEAQGSTTTTFAIGPGSTVGLRLPLKVGVGDPLLVISDESGEQLYVQPFSSFMADDILLVDVHRISPLSAAIAGMPVLAGYDPWTTSPGYYSHGSELRLTAVTPPWDEATGDPVLPERVAGYEKVAAMVIPSDTLSRLKGAQLQALAGYVLGGGTIAVVIERPEDLNHPNLTRMVGAEVTVGSLQAETMAPILIQPPVSTSTIIKPLPTETSLPEALMSELRGFAGGNLRPSLYGSSASYGLGEVHLLAFDPTKKPAVDSGWVQLRTIDLVRRATERRSGILFRQGGVHQVVEMIRQQLDPNEGSRWAIMVASLLLCAYAVLAGPVNFGRWRKRGKPLRALIHLVVLSASSFLVVVLIGLISKGCSGRSRHLTLAEMGAGMKVGTARRWRGFFLPHSQEMNIRAGSATAVLATEERSHGDDHADRLVVDREGARIESLRLMPWETMVIREDSLISLGDGISLTAQPTGETKVVNQTGHRLRGLLLWQPSRKMLLYCGQLDDGASLLSSACSETSSATSVGSSSGLALREFLFYSVEAQLERSATGLTEAWASVGGSLQQRDVDWFPENVPTLLAQVDGGEGEQTDSGLMLESDRLLVRVVGYGGKP